MNRSTAVSVGNISEAAAAAAAAAARTKKSVSASLMLPVDEQEFHAISFGSCSSINEALYARQELKDGIQYSSSLLYEDTTTS